MNAEHLHNDAILFDGLIVSKWGKSVFNEMAEGGLTAANCTCCVWENFTDTMANVAQFKQWFREFDDILAQIYTVDDIRRAKKNRKVGIVLGWQNTSGIDDSIANLALFKELGVGIMQMTYNTQNLVGSGCYESTDSGLSDFGRDVVHEMNQLGILCDLSHVGPKTSRDVIQHSTKPVAYSHVLPAGMKSHPRNKSDDELRFIVEHGGFVGVTMFPPFLAAGAEATVDDYVEAMEYIIDLVGDERVGFGTDFTRGHDDEFFHWITHDKGNGRKLVDVGSVFSVQGLETPAHYSGLTEAMVRAGWSERRIRGVLGENWLQLLTEVWG